MTIHCASRPHYAEAIRWDGMGDTATSIEALIGTARFERPDPGPGCGEDDTPAGVLTDPHASWCEFYPGRWVVRRDDGRVSVLGADEFADAYVELGGS